MTKNLQRDYTMLGGFFQPCLPLNVEFQIPKDDNVRLLRFFIERMDISALMHTYRRIDTNLASPRQMFAILVYAYMNGCYSSRAIESACRRDINYMYLLEGKPAPDHTTISRFRTKHLAVCMKELFVQMDFLLEEFGVLSLENLFVDGTKMESVANKYKFVWKKAVLKNKEKVEDKLPALLEKIAAVCHCTIHVGATVKLHHLKKLRRRMRRYQVAHGLVFVHGSGKRKTPFQRVFEELDSYIMRLKEYYRKVHICGKRNSYAKTDCDATFMRMKEDAMKNGQLKPAYNIQYGVDAEFVTWVGVYPNPTDTTTLIPFLEDYYRCTGKRYRNLIADAGYESEENYLYLRNHGQQSYIKPNNYEIAKTRRFKNDIGRRENMTYLEDEDAYRCAAGKKLVVTTMRRRKSKTGYVKSETVYTCESCDDCKLKTNCIHGHNSHIPLGERTKTLWVSKEMIKERADNLWRIKSEHGILLRINRSIQAEGVFAEVKADRRFRRLLLKGKKNVLTETMLLAMSHNLLKLHAKIQGNRLDRKLILVDNIA